MDRLEVAVSEVGRHFTDSLLVLQGVLQQQDFQLVYQSSEICTKICLREASV
jgi:hypothetical protein